MPFQGQVPPSKEVNANLAWLTFYTLDVGTPKGVESFYRSLFESNWGHHAGEQDLKCSKESNSFAASFMHLRLRREVKGLLEVRKGKVEIGHRTVNKI